MTSLLNALFFEMNGSSELSFWFSDVFFCVDFAGESPLINLWKLNLQTEIGHGSTCFDPGRGWQSLSQRDPMDCKSNSGNQLQLLPPTGPPGTVVAEGL